MKKENGISLIESSLAIMLVTLIFVLGWSLYEGVQKYRQYSETATLILKLVNDTNSFVAKQKDITIFNSEISECIFELNEGLLHKYEITGEDYNNLANKDIKLNVYLRIPNCKSDDFDINKFNYEVLVTAKGTHNQYEASSIISMMDIFGGVKVGKSNTYAGLFRHNIIDLSDWGLSAKEIDLIGYRYTHHDYNKGVRINDVQLIPYEDMKPVEKNEQTWMPTHTDKLLILWSGANMYQSQIIIKLIDNNKILRVQSAQSLTDNAINKYVFYFPREWCQDIIINRTYTLSVEIGGEGRRKFYSGGEVGSRVIKEIKFKMK